MREEFSAGGVVLRGGEMALVQVTNLKGETVWTFPKGHLEAGESAQEAALREVMEETGWRCKTIKPLITVHYQFSRQGVPVSKSVEWFLMEPLEKVGEPAEGEILSCRWATAEAARKLVRYPSDVELLGLVAA